MFNLEYNETMFAEVIHDCVPAYQQAKLLEVAGAEVSIAMVEDVGMTLLGEKTEATFIVPTRGAAVQSGQTAKPTIWAAIKNEVYDLFCTKSTKYADQRKEGRVTVKQLVTIVATAVSGHFSVPLGVVVGAVTLCLMCMLKMGQNAYCEVNKPS